MRRKMCIYKCMLNVYKNQQNRQTGSRNLMGPKTLPTTWGTYMKIVTKYQISAINSCWEKCAYMFNVYKNQPSQQTGSRILRVQKRYPQYGIPLWRLWPNIRFLPSTVTEKYIGRTDGGKTVYPPPPSGSGGIKIPHFASIWQRTWPPIRNFLRMIFI